MPTSTITLKSHRRIERSSTGRSGKCRKERLFFPFQIALGSCNAKAVYVVNRPKNAGSKMNISGGSGR